MLYHAISSPNIALGPPKYSPGMFAAGGLPLSLDVSSPDALVPLLRDAVAKALSLRTVVHLGFWVFFGKCVCYLVHVRKTYEK